MNSKCAFKKIVLLLIIIMLNILFFNILIDPFFHYHKPIRCLSYPIEYERYQNDGIVKHFEYNAIITGTSMAENFKTSELDNLFGTKSIKVTESGASYKEINDLLETAFNNNENISMIIRGLDVLRFFDDRNDMIYEANLYPTYLYDNSILNDIYYLFNKSTLWASVSVIINTVLGNETTSFDDCYNWMSEYKNDDNSYRVGLVNIAYNREKINNNNNNLSFDEKERILMNINSNVIKTIKENPNCKFYIYLTPYSILYFDSIYRDGTMLKKFEAEEIIIKELLKCDNVRLFSFFNDYNIICNLDNYVDVHHYVENINSYILLCMKNGKNEITRENCDIYFKKEISFYNNYNYDLLFN